MHTLRHRGLSLVELLVGLAIGLFIIAGALSLFSANAQSTVVALQEAQLQRNLRQALEFMSQDFKRAGYWEGAMDGAPKPSAISKANPHAAVASAAGGGYTYSYGRDSSNSRPAGVGTLDADEQFGFRLNNGVVEAQQGNGLWQALTDRNAVRITEMLITPNTITTDAREVCSRLCCDAVAPPLCPAVNTTGSCPRLESWEVSIRLTGQSLRLPDLQRSLTTTVRLRNDLLVGRCPP